MEENWNLDEIVNCLHLAFIMMNGEVRLDDPIIKLENEILKSFDEKQKKIYIKLQNEKQKRNTEKTKEAIGFALVNVNKILH